MFRLSTFALGLSLLPELISAAITPEEFGTISLHQQFAAAAYCPGNSQPNGASTGKITCRLNSCPDVQSANQAITWKFSGTPKYNTTGFVAVDRTHQLIVVAFRGTEDCSFIQDAPFVGNCRAGLEALVLTSAPQFCAGCEIAGGWLGAWNEVRADVLKKVREAHNSNPGFRVLSTGHSMGGAMATVAAIELRSEGYTVDLTPFASPRLANEALARFVSSQDDQITPNRPRNRRVTHTGDGINNLPTILTDEPGAPPTAFHFEPSYFIKTGNTPDTTTFADIDILPGIDLLVPNLPILTPAGNLNPINGALNLLAHSVYLNRISQCFAAGTDTQARLLTEASFPLRRATV